MRTPPASVAENQTTIYTKGVEWTWPWCPISLRRLDGEICVCRDRINGSMPAPGSDELYCVPEVYAPGLLLKNRTECARDVILRSMNAVVDQVPWLSRDRSLFSGWTELRDIIEVGAATGSWPTCRYELLYHQIMFLHIGGPRKDEYMIRGGGGNKKCARVATGCCTTR